MNNTLKKIAVHIFVAIIICLPVIALADGETNTGSSKISISVPNPLKGSDGSLISLIVTILNNIVLPIGTVLCVMYIIYAGFTYVMAQGNEKAVSAAHQRLLWALVGTGILLGAAGISKVVESTVTSIIN